MYCIDKYLRPSMPSTKSIHAYFGKAPMPTATSPSISSSILSKADILVTEKAQKREPLPAPGVISKRRTLEKTPLSESTSLIVVEARSRFFGLEASLESSEGGYATKKTRSPVIREDSGTGLDEACLLQLPSIYGSQQDAHSSSSQESSKSDSPSLVLSTPSSQEISETKKAETKVIQGWREKFSNPLGPTLTAATGLTRTFQPGTVKVKSMRSSAKSHSSKHPRAVSSMQQERVKSSCQDTSTVLNKTPKHLPLHSINNNNIHYQTNTMHRPSDSYPRTLITKSPKASLPHMSDVVMLRLGGANALPQTIEAENENESGNVRSTMLNLDRFKYTPVITPAVPESP
ncbi:hypothetical protein BCR41DRAFT_223198 [Lobosporangium transversale]|uniref:Uncharacterized protein n=1 Tax=Lobosporangium transversale TaxID=64571 RepID=A0A1Y2GVX7_9FUNG|nr:hypothetical protein BCR41DRAFT_223198 [Lobosporangium transversale]ORZ26448.1 hypothetical protein BCR41DRAFT_223198 [Lobosporangium transversale]|eukprot:XP_021884213.1 hypothetical protein BCR41DRAFT_223198 [Lobosporangium transversale]